MARSGINRIDGLLAGDSTLPLIAPGDPDRESVGAVQDLLRGHGHKLPSVIANDYGQFGNKTKNAIRDFRQTNGLPLSDAVDPEMLRSLIDVPPPDPVASLPYVTLGLDLEWKGITKVLLLTSVLEGMGKFGALNLNTDKAGLSYGLIQWAQKPGRLTDILVAFRDADSAAYSRIFGAGNASLATALIQHTSKPKGGIDPLTGLTKDPAFDLIDAVWPARFIEAARYRQYQLVQIATARLAFERSLDTLRSYAPEITTERGVAFMLDLANQYGDAGARSIYQTTLRPAQSLIQHRQAMAGESVRRIAEKFKVGVRNRRQMFLDTPLLGEVQLA
ncbi:MAG: peptidoglycan-binding protein [Acidobacteriia bacterium]|nr:peptidoglycan-binding protein [Terriglobia bacterium]